MKELWSILMEKLRLVEPIEALVAIGIMGLFTIGMITIVSSKLFTMITEIVLAFAGQPLK
jgi:hypothetical protein